MLRMGFAMNFPYPAFCQLSSGLIPRHSRPLNLWKFDSLRAFVLLLAPLLFAFQPAHARDKSGIDYGAGLIINVPFPPDQVAQVVRDVVQNGIIRGSKEYNKDEYVSGATAVSESHLFPKWVEGGQVFYKQREHAIDPRNFKNGGDSGTLIVRYVLQPQGDKHTVVHINAIFVEDFRHIVHQSNGSVESAEYKDIHDRLDEIGVMNAETAELQREKSEFAAYKAGTGSSSTGYSSSQPSGLSTTSPPNAATPTQEVSLAEAKAAVAAAPQTLEQRVKQLRSEVERVVKSPGAALKSAPFHTATTLQSLPPGAEVLIVINTTYWLGVETHDGQHGWILRDALEQTK